MYRYVVPADGQPHTLDAGGHPRQVAADRYPTTPGKPPTHVVEFWAEHNDSDPGSHRTFQVFATGHPLPDGATWRGTCARTPGGLTWHLFEIPGGGT
jgi:hypothetical protein